MSALCRHIAAKSICRTLQDAQISLLSDAWQSGHTIHAVCLTLVAIHDRQREFESVDIRCLAILTRPFHDTLRHAGKIHLLGGVHSIEAKRGKNSGLWHPHAHMIWLCHEEPAQAKLSQEWKDWTGDSFIVDVRPFHDQEDVVSGFMEVFKYALKFSELPLDDNWDAYEQLSGKRLVDAFGLLRGVEISDELTDEPILDELPYIELFYQWMNRAGYSLMKTTNASTVKGETGSRTRSAAEGEHRTGEHPAQRTLDADGAPDALWLGVRLGF